MSNYQCSCYWEYPNPMHRHNNGKWKCVDNYEKCEDWKPKSVYSCKTHCRRKGDHNMTVLVAMPTTGSIPNKVVASLINLKTEEPNIQFVFDENSLVYDSRNSMLEQAIINDFDYLMFIDSDVIFPAEAVCQLLADKKDIVTGIYYERKGNHRPVLFKNVTLRDGDIAPSADFVTEFPNDKPFEIDACGMGFCLINTKAVFPVIKKYKSPFEPYEGLGEDLSFCYKCRQEGIKIYADPRFDLKHIGIQAFGKEDFNG